MLLDLVAHRGYSAYAPENSIPAFEMAVASGFSKIELDIRRCKPDSNGKATWVISHNDSLKIQWALALIFQTQLTANC